MSIANCKLTVEAGQCFKEDKIGRKTSFLGWGDYKAGFGRLINSEFWLENDNIHRLTASRSASLRVELEDMNIRYSGRLVSMGFTTKD